MSGADAHREVPTLKDSPFRPGDAVPTIDHMTRGQVLRGARDIEQARGSFKEAIEIADRLIPGHDNLTPNMLKQMF